jgi:hypothetical protein
VQAGERLVASTPGLGACFAGPALSSLVVHGHASGKQVACIRARMTRASSGRGRLRSGHDVRSPCCCSPCSCCRSRSRSTSGSTAAGRTR